MSVDDQYNDPFEDRLSAALQATGSDFDTDRPALAAAGTARGRRLRARRNVAVVGGAAAVALACVSGALLVANGGDADGAPRTSSVAASRTAAATPSGDGVTAEQLLTTLKSLLPEGMTSKETGSGTEGGAAPYASLVYDDGRGAAAIGVNLDRVEPGGGQARELSECPDKRFTNHDECSVRRLPNGSVLKLYQGYEYPDRRVETKLWRADLITASGQYVSLTEWNAPAEKGEAVTRPQPPLSPAQLETVVTAHAWLPLVDALPEDGTKPTTAPVPGGSDDGIGGQRLIVVLTRLMPKDVKVVDKSGEDSQYGYVVVDDGKGESFVQINVQPDMNDVRDQLFDASDETLPDGTRVATHQGPGEKGMDGVVMWTVDTIRPDGRRIVISAFNAGSQVTPATRTDPALTMDELRRIALSPEWEALD
ncbi:hypothetical protein [Streptomyces sp. bgisy153]|uniref:hypothetical protein n=1 Tax=Streptomyces sp. bgisy153 TaxID=3413793 RepID=UPI003D7172A6